MAKLKDVADLTGLSISTISYVLNGKKKVKEETYQRIMEAVEKVGYRPNQLARSLKTRQTLTIGVVVPDISNEFFPQIVKGIDDKAHDFNYNIILCNTNNDVDREEDYINTLLSKDIDGIIFIGTAKSQTILENKTNIPIVLVDRKMGEQYISVVSDNYKGGYLATEHLIERGKKSIALLSGQVFIKTFFDRMKGYMDALKDNSIIYNEDYVVGCDFTTQGGYDGINELIKKNIEFNAVFAANDLIALGAMRALMENGKKIPDDVAIVGYDDIVISSTVMPSLTTIRQPKYEMGQYAADILIKSIANKSLIQEHIVLQPSMIVREST